MRLSPLFAMLVFASCGGLATSGNGGSAGEGGSDDRANGRVGAGGTGESAVYMTVDAGGFQRRDIFYTDTPSIYCVVSSGERSEPHG
jgi:hypothetical protein